MEAMCHAYAAVSYFCIGDAESSSQVEIFLCLEVYHVLYPIIVVYV